MLNAESKIPLTFKIYQNDKLVCERTLTKNIVKIGALETSHLRIDDDTVSRMHAVIEVTGPGEIHIIDLGSQAGTIINGRKVLKCALQDGDVILFGRTHVMIGIGEPVLAVE